jgi:electron transfer DM13
VRRILLVLGALAVAVGLWAFEPWRLFTSSHLDEPAPASAPSQTTTQSPGPAPTAASTPRDVVLSTGTFVDAEHDTSGTARILQLADGRRFLRLEQLAGSDGPDLHVWLSDARSGGDWHSYDDGRHVELGGLKATHGNQNYAIPADTDLSGLRSVVIWCDRFNVAFGTAPVRVR